MTSSMKWGGSVRSKSNHSTDGTTGNATPSTRRSIRKPWLSDKKAAHGSFEVDNVDALLSSLSFTTSPHAPTDEHGATSTTTPSLLSKRTKKSSSRTLMNIATATTDDTTTTITNTNTNTNTNTTTTTTTHPSFDSEMKQHPSMNNDPTDHTESTMTTTNGGESIMDESSIRITEAVRGENSQVPPPTSPADDKYSNSIPSIRSGSNSFDGIPTSSPVMEVVKRLQDPSSLLLSSATKTKIYDIPTLDVPVKEKASDYESGKLLQAPSSSKHASHLSQEILHIVEEGMVMKKVEHVELTEQQLLRKQLAIAAAAVANRWMAEELARRTAIQQMETIIEQEAAAAAAQEAEDARQRQAQEDAAALQHELWMQKRRKQKEQDELELLRQQKNEAKIKAAMEQQEEEEEEAQQAAAKQKQQQEEAELEIQKELRKRIEDAKAKAKEVAMIQLQNEVVELEQIATDNTLTTAVVESKNVTPVVTSMGKYDDIAIPMNGSSITSKRSAYNENQDVIHEEDEEDDDEEEEEKILEDENDEDPNETEQNVDESKNIAEIESSDIQVDNMMEVTQTHDPPPESQSEIDMNAESIVNQNKTTNNVEPIEETPIDNRTVKLPVVEQRDMLADDPDVDVGIPTQTPMAQDFDDDDEYEEEEIVEDDNVAPEDSTIRNDNVLRSPAAVTAMQRAKPEPIVTALPTPVSVQQQHQQHDDDDNFIEEEVNVEENEPFHHFPSAIMQQKPPQTVIANHNFDQRNNIPDDVSNFSNDDSSLLQQQQQQFTSSSTPNQLFHKSSNLSTTTTTGGSSTTSQNNNNSNNGTGSSPRRSISDIIRHDLWNSNEVIVEHALQQLAEKASIHNSYRNAIARAGGILAIIRAMEKHVNHVGIQIASCMALEKLAIDTENELAIGEVGGIEQILHAMMAHYTNEKVQEAAWSALWNCTCGNACDTMTIDTTPGGMSAVINCMKEHIDNVTVQVSACNTIMNLCYDNNERIQLLVQADGFGAIMEAIQRHYSNEIVRNEMSYILCTLLEKNVKQHYVSQQQQHDNDGEDEEYEEEVFEEEAL